MMLKSILDLLKIAFRLDKRNAPDTYILDWWIPKTNIQDGIRQVFNEMKKNYGY